MLTSVQVGVGLVGPQEHGLPRLQPHQVEEINGEAADVPWVLGVQPQQQVPIAPRRVLPFRCCMSRAGAKLGGAPSPPLNAAPPKLHWGAAAGGEDPPSWEILFTSMFSWSTKNFFSLFIRRVKQTRRAAETPRGSSLPLRSSCSAATSPISARSSGTAARGVSTSHPRGCHHPGAQHPQPEAPKPPSPPQTHHREGRWHWGPSS